MHKFTDRSNSSSRDESDRVLLLRPIRAKPAGLGCPAGQRSHEPSPDYLS
jgi:hypothetical protein